jgi:hypothetical protein
MTAGFPFDIFGRVGLVDVDEWLVITVSLGMASRKWWKICYPQGPGRAII